MSVKTSILNNVIYIRFNRKDHRDSEQFRKELESPAVLENSKDIVIDFTGSILLTSSEIGMLLSLTTVLDGTKRQLKLIVTPMIATALEDTGIQGLKNVSVYSEKELFIDDTANGQKLEH